MTYISEILSSGFGTDKFWSAFEIIVSVYEAFVIMHFICALFDHNFKSKKGMIIYLLGTSAAAAYSLVLNRIFLYEGLAGFAYAINFFVFSLIFLHGKVVTKIYAAVFTDLCLICLSAIAVNLSSVIFKCDINTLYTEKNLARLVMIIIGQTLLFCTFVVVLKIYKKSRMNLGKKEWIFITVIFSVSFISIAAIQSTLQQNVLSRQYIGFLMAAELGLILINIICFYMMSLLSSSHKAAEELSALKQQEELRRQYAENIKYRYDEIRRIRHDMKQSYTVLETLLSENHTEEAIAYIHAGKSAITKTEVLINVGNDFVNSILNSKLSTAKQRGIEVICSSVRDLSGIEAVDLCTLLGNLLDNAIEAAEKCPDEKRLIEIKITSSEDKTVIQTTNSIESSVLDKNSEMSSTKENPSEHGFGVKSIRLIAKKYSGTVNYFEDEGTLSCRVVLYR